MSLTRTCFESKALTIWSPYLPQAFAGAIALCFWVRYLFLGLTLSFRLRIDDLDAGLGRGGGRVNLAFRQKRVEIPVLLVTLCYWNQRWTLTRPDWPFGFNTDLLPYHWWFWCTMHVYLAWIPAFLSLLVSCFVNREILVKEDLQDQQAPR